MNRINIKPMSVNRAWQGKRFKTKEYNTYILIVKSKLPKIEIPKDKLEIKFRFGFSNSSSDVDNPVKPIMDIMQKKYGFNDSRVYRITAEKEITKKGKEFFEFEIGYFGK